MEGVRPDSPQPSCVSMKSDRSMDCPRHFKDRGCSTDLSVMEGTRPDTPEPSCVSMKSDQSIDPPRNFKGGGGSTDLRQQKEKLNVTYRDQLESTFKELELKVISMLKNELNKFKKLLNIDYPACSEQEVKDVEDLSRFREGALKITLNVLKIMNQTDLANTLQRKLLDSVYQKKLKSNLREKCKRISEGISQHGSSALLNEIYTELYITEGWSGDVNNEHEVRQIEAASRRPATQENPIKCNDLFKDTSIRTVLTKGIAGIGKTVSVQKFILDWAEGESNQDLIFIFPLPFRELNLMKQENLSLMELLHQFFPEVKDLSSLDYCAAYKVLFIFDGLDECRLPLDFQKNKILCDVTESASVDVLLTNLIKGNLLPSAHLWITSRPAAANQIPPECVDQVTEVRGFSDPQTEEYFRKRISDENLASKIITHIKSSRSLYIMCHIPVFCWISSSVLERILDGAEGKEIPKTLTQMFTYFLIFQIKHKEQKYHEKSDPDPHQTRETILALGKLAFQQLEKGNLIFYEEDLTECGIDLKNTSVYSGVCTQIFKKEAGLHLGQVFSFVHLSVQEFLAALYVFLTFINKNRNVLVKKHTRIFNICINSMSDFLKSALDKALQSKNGHLDLFLRFLLGLSLESNQTLLRGLLPQTGSSSYNKEETVRYIKEKISENPSPEKSINLFHCLNELNDDSLVQEVQQYMNRRGFIDPDELSPAQWSALVFVLLNSDQELDEFDLRKYYPSHEGLLKMLLVVKASRKAELDDCNLTEESCEVLSSVLSLNSSSLKHLILSNNNLKDSGVKLLSAGMENPHCKLEILELVWCNLTEESCEVLSSVLSLNSSSLKHLNLDYNKLKDSGVKLLSAGLENPHCKLEILELNCCSITDEGFTALASALKSNPSSRLRELHLTENYSGEPGVKLLKNLQEDLQCNLEELHIRWLWNCDLTRESCEVLSSVLSLNSSSLKHLNLSYNKLKDSGVKLLSAGLENPHCKLEILELWRCSITDEGFIALGSALKSNSSSRLRKLQLSDNNPGESGVKLLKDLQEDPQCNLKELQLWYCDLTEESCEVLSSVLSLNSSSLKHLNLSNNKLKDSGVKLLSAGLENPQCKLEILVLVDCDLTEKSCEVLSSVLHLNSSSLKHLNLSNNNLKDSGVKLLSAGLENPHCKLEILELKSCSNTDEGFTALASALKSNPSSRLRELNLNNNHPGESGVKLLKDLQGDPQCNLKELRLWKCDLTEESCEVLSSVLSLNSSSLKHLNLSNNKLKDSGVNLLSAGLENPHCKLEILELWRCSITDEGFTALASALKSNPSSRLRELQLSDNDPGESGVKLLKDLQEDPQCNLKELHIQF
ncbi:NACHT, LRR and PYD domains-containing protein 12-like [Trichomycterus rosablanca]|uniref:NACHT, LRR and PYD domains-containing protein 12-like n=1 Tax=Trichomycterus rosablanca TaxID=2290929 RepID=UPI002F35A6C0